MSEPQVLSPFSPSPLPPIPTSSFRLHPLALCLEAQHRLRAVVRLDLEAAVGLVAQFPDALDGVRQVARAGPLAAEHDLDVRRVVAVRLEVNARQRQPVLDPEVLLDAVLHPDDAEPRRARAVALAELLEERPPARTLDLSRHAPLRQSPVCLCESLQPLSDSSRRLSTRSGADCASGLPFAFRLLYSSAAPKFRHANQRRGGAPPPPAGSPPRGRRGDATNHPGENQRPRPPRPQP